MTPEQFTEALDRLGWNQAYFAELVGRHPNRISDWATGKVAVPKWAALILAWATIIQQLPERVFSGKI